jgi:hypothetical protein
LLAFLSFSCCCLNSEAFTTLGTARIQNMATTFCFHANTKTVGAFTTGYWWLICTFHNYFLANLRFSLFSQSPSIVICGVFFYFGIYLVVFADHFILSTSYPQLIHQLILCG